MKKKIDYTLYLVTDRALMSSATVEELVEQAILGGVTMVQLREKDCAGRAFYESAVKVRAVTARLGVPLIINNRADIALAVDADGVHVGQNDLPAEAARRIVGPDKIIGVSAGNLSEALAAVRNGADYLGVGAMFATATKPDAGIVSFIELRRIREAVSLPVVVIGGINKKTAPLFRGTGANGLAVVSAIVAQKDVAGAARAMRDLL